MTRRNPFSLGTRFMALFGLLLFSMSNSAISQGFPTRPITLVVPSAPGGGNDSVARPLSERLTQILGQPVLLEHRAGANANIGAAYVAKATPDGYTLLLANSSLPINVSLYNKLAYDAVKDFAPVGLAAISASVLLVHPSMPVKTLPELIAYSKARPGQLNFTSAGAGSTNHLAAELMNSMAGLSMTHIPHKGAAPAMADVVGGHAQLLFINVPPALGLIRGGSLRALAVTTPERSSVLPDVPTMDEAGLKGYSLTTWFGLMAPTGTPPDVINRLSRALGDAVNTKELQDRFKAAGLEPRLSAPDEMGQTLLEDIGGWAKLVKASGAKED